MTKIANRGNSLSHLIFHFAIAVKNKRPLALDKIPLDFVRRILNKFEITFIVVVKDEDGLGFRRPLFLAYQTVAVKVNEHRKIVLWKIHVGVHYVISGNRLN